MEKMISDTRYHINKYLLAFILSFTILCFFLVLNHEIYLPIGSNISDFTGDGIKNFFTFAYYLRYDNDLHFSGLFYPYRELIIYMDAQPLWVWIIKTIETIFHFHVENPLVYIHLILLFNMFIAGFFLFLILFHYCNHYPFAILGTTIIVLLSPQIFRFQSHYALGNMGIIPMFWWWYICLSKHTKLIPHLIFSFLLLLTGYIHPYLMLMLVFFFLSYELIYAIAAKKIPYAKLSYILLALILFQFSIKITDNVTDRPTRAWGAKEFACKIHDILLPLNGCIKEYFIRIIPKIETGYTEGHGYISIFGIIVLILLLYGLVKNILSRRLPNKLAIGSATHWVLASIPVLLFAFFIPFRWHMDWLINLITPLKQFRGTGRFVAVFYYAYLVFAFVYFKKLYDAAPKSMTIVLILCTVISAYDILNNSNYLVENHRKFGKQNAYGEFKDKCSLLVSKVKNIDDYQCIIPYPPSTEGTEIVWLNSDWFSKVNYFWLSYFYHLPIASVHSSRASFKDAISIVQLSGYFTTPKPILEKFDNTKKCLVITSSKYINDDVPLLKKAVYIDRVDDLILLSIDLKDMPNPAKSTLGAPWIDSSYVLLGQNTFDQQPKGYLKLGDNKEKKDVLTIHVKDDKKDKLVRILFWYTPKITREPSVPIAEAYNTTNNKEIFIKDWRETYSNTYNYVNGWFCVDYNLPLNNETTDVNFKVYSEGILIDNFAVYLKQ